MTTRASTRLTFYRTPEDSTATNEWGEPVDEDVPHLTGVLAALQEETVRQWQPSERRLIETQMWVARIRPDLDVRDDDRVQDEKTGARYVIESVHRPTSYIGWRRIRLQLKHID
ncbi:hypothetical protein ACFVWN_01050 [Nocardiopsis flavescens]|uniref:hypothetical protein n=1 Tax=Nocardiopsis flavescens TaxID=758803 RepID=UPI00365571D1